MVSCGTYFFRTLRTALLKATTGSIRFKFTKGRSRLNSLTALLIRLASQPATACTKLTIETIGQGVKYVQS